MYFVTKVLQTYLCVSTENANNQQPIELRSKWVVLFLSIGLEIGTDMISFPWYQSFFSNHQLVVYYIIHMKIT
jgi:hypothetical protein